MKITRILLPGILVIFLIGHAYSQTLSYRFSGTIDYLQGDSHGGFFNIGTPITGWYCFNTTAEDFNPSSKLIQTYSIGNPYGFEISINGIDFKTDRASMIFANDNGGTDNYGVSDTKLTPSAYFNGSENLNYISGGMNLIDRSQTYFSGPEVFVPLTSPNLSQFDHKLIWLYGDDTNGGPGFFTINATINELYEVPEPGTILLIGMGIALLRRKR